MLPTTNVTKDPKSYQLLQMLSKAVSIIKGCNVIKECKCYHWLQTELIL